MRCEFVWCESESESSPGKSEGGDACVRSVALGRDERSWSCSSCC
jgi:hypothetical protein